MQPTFTLIIPAYNEAPVITPTLELLRDAFEKQARYEWAIVVVDNASTDDMSHLVRALNDPRITAMVLAEKGKGHAVRAGFRETTSQFVGFTDADLSVPPHEIIRALDEVCRGNVDVVIGSRFHPESVMPGREWWRIGSSQLFNYLARLMIGVTVSDTQCPLKIMNDKGKALMLATVDRTWFFDLEFLAYAKQSDLRIDEMPVTWNEHRYPDRKSKVSALRDGFRALNAFVDIRARLRAKSPQK